MTPDTLAAEQSAPPKADRPTYSTDLYELDEDWSDEQKAVIQQIRRFVDKEVLPETRDS